MTNFSSTYPNIAAWTETYGWIEIGRDDDRPCAGHGGMVWEGKPKYKSVDAALDDLEWRSKRLLRRLGNIHEFSTNARMSAPLIDIS